MSNNRPKSVLRKLIRDAAIIVSVTVLLFALAEGALRVLPIKIDPDRVKVPAALAPTGLACEFHPDYLIKLKANLEKRYTRSKENGGDEIVWRTNSLGFRGPELKENPDLRVVVYGDSNIQARFSRLEDTFPARLEAELAGMLDKEVEVINAGVLGFGPDQSLLKFKEEADMLKPDLVLLHFFADNDYGDVIRNRIFDLDRYGKLIKTTHERIPDIMITGKGLAEKGFFAKLAITRFIKRKKTKRVQRPFLSEDTSLEKRTRREYEVFRDGRAREYSHFDDHYDWIVATMPESADSTANVRFVEEIFREARSFAERKGIRFMVLIEPSAFDTQYHTLTSTLKERISTSFPAYDPRNLAGLAEAALKRNKIPGLNLFDLFSRNNPKGLFFTINNDHWNDKGQALAAKGTAAYIMDNGLLE